MSGWLVAINRLTLHTFVMSLCRNEFYVNKPRIYCPLSPLSNKWFFHCLASCIEMGKSSVMWTFISPFRHVGFPIMLWLSHFSAANKTKNHVLLKRQRVKVTSTNQPDGVALCTDTRWCWTCSKNCFLNPAPQIVLHQFSFWAGLHGVNLGLYM